ncbi:MAG: DNA mismatch endonuclease Vsr [Lentisphaerae bacterium]|jgi:DNA mismatch endonuclease (patch repair protein)|nr:DNA mismatch endonuclease Vsr [Lentisphaerota bacterium]
MDIWSPEKRSEVMARIRSRDTKPELVVRSLLHRCGVRFSLRRRDLPGKPDIVLPKYKTVIFVHGCFWHRHAGCRLASEPKSRQEFWQAKFEANVARDRRNQRALKEAGWRVIVLWECEVMRDPLGVVQGVLELLRPAGKPINYDALPDRRSVLKVAEERFKWNLRDKTT